MFSKKINTFIYTLIIIILYLLNLFFQSEIVLLQALLQSMILYFLVLISTCSIIPNFLNLLNASFTTAFSSIILNFIKRITIPYLIIIVILVNDIILNLIFKDLSHIFNYSSKIIISLLIVITTTIFSYSINNNDFIKKINYKQPLRFSILNIILYWISINILSFNLIQPDDGISFSAVLPLETAIGGINLSFCILPILLCYDKKLNVEPNLLSTAGKFIFGFNLFWAYLFYMQILIFWYGGQNEGQFIISKLYSEPQLTFLYVILIFHILLPTLLLLPAKFKSSKIILTITAFLILLTSFLKFLWYKV